MYPIWTECLSPLPAQPEGTLPAAGGWPWQAVHEPPIGWNPFECEWQTMQFLPVLWPVPVPSARWWLVAEWQASHMLEPLSLPKLLAPVKLRKLIVLPFITFFISIMLLSLWVLWQ